jgi:serine phosphatase RsbU (regulator of sigma subunit)
MGLQFDIAIRSTHKYAVSASGDAARIVDLPDGGVGLVVADGQGSGPSARAVSRQVAGQIAESLSAGARAMAAAEAASDALFAARSGQVSVSFDIVRVSRQGAIEIARCSTNALLLFDGVEWRQVPQRSEPGGRAERQQPQECLLDADAVCAVVIATDGIDGAGRKYGREWSLLDTAQSLAGQPVADLSVSLADRLFFDAMELDSGRPGDDMTIAALVLRPAESDQRIERHQFSRVVR